MKTKRGDHRKNFKHIKGEDWGWKWAQNELKNKNSESQLKFTCSYGKRMYVKQKPIRRYIQGLSIWQIENRKNIASLDRNDIDFLEI